MAESPLSRIADSLIAKISSSYIQQTSLDLGVYHDLQALINYLLSFKAVLLETDKFRCPEFLLQRMLRKLKHILSDAENVVDEFECERLRNQVLNAHGNISAITKVGGFFSTSNPLAFRRLRISKQIKELNKRLSDCLLGMDTVGLPMINFVVDEIEYERLRNQVVNAHVSAVTKVGRFFSTSNPLAFRPLRMAKQINELNERLSKYRAMRMTDVAPAGENPMMGTFESSLCSIPGMIIGREDDKEIIINLLLQQNPCGVDHHSVSVIPIVGMAGLGKTKLAHSVFYDERIDDSFSSKIWVSVSHGFNIRQVIARIIQSAAGTLAEMEEQQLNQVRNILASRKFLLVFDDVWNEDPLKWAVLRNLISIGMEGSKILVTTRSHSIASIMGTTPSHTLKALSMEDSLSLFEICAFEEGEEKLFPDLIKIGREIVNKCGGVPLAIKSMGSMLRSKYVIEDWKHIRYTEFWDFPGDPILYALRLSYHYMPSHLKQCFELFSLYPNGFVFHSSEVASLWAALGLLPSPNKDETLIDVANQCLLELMSRSFLQEFVNFGTSYYFQIHDLVHDLARSIAKDECQMIYSDFQYIHENVQHLSFPENDLIVESPTSKSVVVRTILFPIEGVGASSEAFLNMCVSSYRYLRILDLSDSTYETLPLSTGNLRHLRFLSLERNEKIKRVPDSICKLQNLLVLNLAGCTKLEKLPEGLRNLISLRQLGITTKESALPENDIANLNYLEVLNIESCDNIESFFVGIKLATLKTLTITSCGRLQSLPLDINHFPQLETLLVDNCGYLELTKRHDDQSFNLRLKAIQLHSLPQLLTLPRWIQESTNTLQSLLIVECKNLEMLPEWLSTLSFLVSFGVANSPKLMSLPNDIHRLTALGYLRIEGCPELCRKCQPQVGEYWPKISHIKQNFIDEPKDLNEYLVEEEELLEEEQ